ncbi:hypothetical protein C5167_045572 [Papaver somniferum]|uniref:PATROL1-like C-terminal domain-containing protein n=1 Tax=Papaver somniferum TaxID=3469 RepID=A0A4Y7LE09_PAPSO|nr:hypothetical protein C5167_045572 [Papaver somniferum]
MDGTKIVFWDLREPFINNLYRPNVSQSRLELLIDPLDLKLKPRMEAKDRNGNDQSLTVCLVPKAGNY